MRILKFSSSALESSESVKQARDLVIEARKRSNVVVVMSALGGVTDQLTESADCVLDSYDKTMDIFNRLHALHLEVIKDIIPPAKRSSIIAGIQILFNDLEDILHAVNLVHECSPGSLDLIMSFGTRLSSKIMEALLNTEDVPCTLVDSRQLITTFDSSLTRRGVVRIDETSEKIRKTLIPSESVYVVTGANAADDKGVTTSLGRRGSDFTATLAGAALGAEEVEIWTDRDGIYSADPELVPEAGVIKRMAYEEAQEMAYFGADMIHSQALQPALEKNIPVTIRSIFNRKSSGTLITKGNGSNNLHPVQAITTIDGVSLVNLEGSGMTGVPGIAGRLFSALAKRNVDIVMISQASSEHSICFVVPPGDLETAVDATNKTFEMELNAGLIQRVEQMDKLVVLSIIGSKMRGTPGISAKFFGALGEKGINILIISQGSSERNISIVISETDKLEALRAVHNAFFTEDNGSGNGKNEIGTGKKEGTSQKEEED